jgi:hypothetical protein
MPQHANAFHLDTVQTVTSISAQVAVTLDVTMGARPATHSTSRGGRARAAGARTRAQGDSHAEFADAIVEFAVGTIIEQVP